MSTFERHTERETPAHKAHRDSGPPYRGNFGLIGVFISVTTVPAAGFAVVAATVGDWDIAAQSAAQLAVNLIGITMAGVLVLWVYQRAHRR